MNDDSKAIERNALDALYGRLRTRVVNYLTTEAER